MLHHAGLVFFRRHLPDFLETDAVFLRLDAIAQIEAINQNFAERTAGALGKDRVLAAKLHAAGKRILDLAVLADAEIAGGDADDLAILAGEHFRSGKARIDFDAERFGFRREIAREIAERGDEV